MNGTVYAIFPEHTLTKTSIANKEYMFNTTSCVAQHYVPYIDLQWFAAEDEGRTEDASEQKKRKAREEEGRVAKSQDLNSALCLFFAVLAFVLLAPWIFKQCIEIVLSFIVRSTEPDLSDMQIFFFCTKYFLKIFLPIAGTAMLFGIIGNIVQNGGMLVSPKLIVPKFSKVAPKFGQYFKRVFGLEGMVKLAMSLLKIIIIGIVAYLMIQSELPKFLGLMQTSVYTGFLFVASIAARLLIAVAVILLVLAVFDYFFQRWQYQESLKMTKQEVKQEIKEDMGDPLVRSRQQQRMREILNQNIAAVVPHADVVITNPTHFAVAIEFDAAKMEGPTVIAKGADESAQRIKAIARDNHVTIVENRPLARALYANVDVGNMIPAEYYKMIVLVFQYVLKLDKTKAAKWGYFT